MGASDCASSREDQPTVLFCKLRYIWDNMWGESSAKMRNVAIWILVPQPQIYKHGREKEEGALLQ